MSEYKYTLQRCGDKDKVKLQAALEHLKTFPLWKDSEAKLVSYSQYMDMVESGEIRPPVSYWKVDVGQYGFVVLTSYKEHYDHTWQLIAAATQDFTEGWEACLKSLNNSYENLQNIQKEYGEIKAKEAIRHAAKEVRNGTKRSKEKCLR